MTGIDARNPPDVQDGQNVNPQDEIIVTATEVVSTADALIALSEAMQALGFRPPSGSPHPADAALLIRRLAAERDNLLADIVEAHGNTDAAIDDYNVMKAERDALQAEIDRLREALKPFAEMTDTECDFDIAPHMDWFESRERARAALNKGGATP
jgi:uncharacterized protein (DUF1501 family)